jgi:hypothetical protein
VELKDNTTSINFVFGYEIAIKIHNFQNEIRSYIYLRVEFFITKVDIYLFWKHALSVDFYRLFFEVNLRVYLIN